MIDDVVMVNKEDFAALTWFIRCASCHTMYVAASGWEIGAKMTDAVWWTRPKTLFKNRKAVCKHEGAVERWTGTKWVPQVVNDERESTHE